MNNEIEKLIEEHKNSKQFDHYLSACSMCDSFVNELEDLMRDNLILTKREVLFREVLEQIVFMWSHKYSADLDFQMNALAHKALIEGKNYE